jgi:hypothetical protein
MPTVEKTIIQVPQPKALIKNEVMKVSEKVKIKTPVIAETKRGRGRPRKIVAEKINKSTKHLQEITVKGKGKK